VTGEIIVEVSQSNNNVWHSTATWFKANLHSTNEITTPTNTSVISQKPWCSGPAKCLLSPVGIGSSFSNTTTNEFVTKILTSCNRNYRGRIAPVPCKQGWECRLWASLGLLACPTMTTTIAISSGGSGTPPKHGSLGPPESTSQTAPRSVQPFS